MTVMQSRNDATIKGLAGTRGGNKRTKETVDLRTKETKRDSKDSDVSSKGKGGYDVYKKDSDSAKSFRAAYKDAKGAAFEWDGRKYAAEPTAKAETKPKPKAETKPAETKPAETKAKTKPAETKAKTKAETKATETPGQIAMRVAKQNTKDAKKAVGDGRLFDKDRTTLVGNVYRARDAEKAVKGIRKKEMVKDSPAYKRQQKMDERAKRMVPFDAAVEKAQDTYDKAKDKSGLVGYGPALSSNLKALNDKVKAAKKARSEARKG